MMDLFEADSIMFLLNFGYIKYTFTRYTRPSFHTKHVISMEQHDKESCVTILLFRASNVTIDYWKVNITLIESQFMCL